MYVYQRIFIQILIVVLFLQSCKTKNYKLLVVVDEKEMSVNTNVILDGYVIGKVEDIKIHNNKILTTLVIKKDAKISKFSQFYIQDIDALGKQAIFIVSDKIQTDFYANNDTVEAKVKENIFSTVLSDTQIVRQVQILVDTIKTVIKRDTIKLNY